MGASENIATSIAGNFSLKVYNPSGGLSNYLSMIIAYPFGPVIGEVQVSNENKSALIEAEKKLRKEGLQGFFKGLPKSFVRNAAGGALTFLAYEFMVRVLGGLKIFS